MFKLLAVGKNLNMKKVHFFTLKGCFYVSARLGMHLDAFEIIVECQSDFSLSSPTVVFLPQM